eukprot:133679-Alexandrium_andersonii.AAC.1
MGRKERQEKNLGESPMFYLNVYSGLMNLCARSLGGIVSDVLFNRFGFRGRLWAQFLALFSGGLSLLASGLVNNDQA